MSRLDDIRALLDVADDALAGIRAEYDSSLHAKAVSAQMRDP
jgi:hypothetical protein